MWTLNPASPAVLEQVKPAFGVSSEDLDICVRGGMIEYGSAQVRTALRRRASDALFQTHDLSALELSFLHRSASS